MVLKKKKVLKLVVCMSLIIALAISVFALSAGASFENTHYNSGNQAQDIVGVAQTQVGYYEGSNSYTKYGDWYGLPNSDWCAMFVSWCANQAGIDESVFPRFALCSAGCDYFMSKGQFNYSGSYIPKPGDLIFYASYGSIYHVGLVTGCDGSNVYSIEGNYNECVSNVSYSLSYGDILGYATPGYSVSGDAQQSYDSETDTWSDNVTDSELIYQEVYTDSDEETELELESGSDGVTDSDEYTDSDEQTDSEELTSDTESEEDVESEIDTETEIETETDIETDSELIDTDSEEEPEYLTGDVDGNGIVNSIDLILIQRHLAQITDLNDECLLRADVDGSGEVNVLDCVELLNIIADLNV